MSDPTLPPPADHASWSMLALSQTLLITLLVAYYLKQYKVTLVHESIIALLLGMLVGVASMGKWQMSFNNRYFFNMLLPPIILHSGYDLHVESFLKYFCKCFGQVLEADRCRFTSAVGVVQP